MKISRKAIKMIELTAPQNLRADKVTGLSVVLVWDPPLNHGSSLTEYIIHCDKKNPIRILRPSENKLPITYKIIDDLAYETSYKFIVKAKDTQNISPPSNELQIETKKNPLDFKFYCMPIYGANVKALGYFADNGIDFSAPQNTECRAVTSGYISFAGDAGNDVGLRVDITPDRKIENAGFVSESIFYSHLKSIPQNILDGYKKYRDSGRNESYKVKIKAGELIGYSGRANDSDHLHFGIYADKDNEYCIDNRPQWCIPTWDKCYNRDQVYETLTLRFDQKVLYDYRGSSFSDVPHNYWARIYIEMLYKNNYVKGISIFPPYPPQYAPTSFLTRDQGAVFVLRGIHGSNYKPEEPKKLVFYDTPEGEWFTKWVTQLYIDGYTEGCRKEGNKLYYCPNDPLTRAQATVFFLRILIGPEQTPDEIKIPSGLLYDDVPIHAWYAKWVYNARKKGIIGKCEDPKNLNDNRFRPNEPITRAEAACMMCKAMILKGLLP